MTQPLVTIGIPTFMRPELLKRALACVAAQDYANLEVLVADNCTPGHAVQDVVDSFKDRISTLTYIKRQNNIGPFKNFIKLIDEANGEYFMWFADDDEISSNYVSSLVSLLENNPDASSAAGHWILMQNEEKGRLMPTSSFPQKSAFVRALRFVWKTDDAFFYGLHRTSVIRKASFPGYWWPNKDVLSNWAYVFLMDMVLNGRILISNDRSVQFINHCYFSKNYDSGKRHSMLVTYLQYLIRRLNVHYFYLLKIAQSLNLLALLPILFVSLAAIFREFGFGFVRGILRKAGQVMCKLAQ